MGCTDQDRADVIEGTMPSSERRPREKHMHIPVEAQIGYEERAKPKDLRGFSRGVLVLGEFR